jgi:hypothetical protein
MNLLNMAQKSLHGVIRGAFMTISDLPTFNLLEFLNNFPSQVTKTNQTFILRSFF